MFKVYVLLEQVDFDGREVIHGCTLSENKADAWVAKNKDLKHPWIVYSYEEHEVFED